jgi:Flp pilus assembly protein protease CpaA
MLELISLLTALIGSSIAAAWDLKTTEIPDEIPHIMIVLGLVLNGVHSYLLWSYVPILSSVVVGLSLLGLGFLMYFLGQWGGGDAKVLSAIGFLIPTLPTGFTPNLFFPFPLSFLANVFLIGAIYMLVYAFVIALMNRKIIHEFLTDMKASSTVLLVGSIALFTAFIGVNYFLITYFHLNSTTNLLVLNSLIPLVATVALYVVWKFARIVENVGFKKRIPLSKLRIGDVLLENRLWEGITEKELNKIKKSGKRYVTIKQGIRFAPAFPMAIIFTLYVGDAILLFSKVLT